MGAAFLFLIVFVIIFIMVYAFTSQGLTESLDRSHGSNMYFEPYKTTVLNLKLSPDGKFISRKIPLTVDKVKKLEANYVEQERFQLWLEGHRKNIAWLRGDSELKEGVVDELVITKESGISGVVNKDLSGTTKNLHYGRVQEYRIPDKKPILSR